MRLTVPGLEKILKELKTTNPKAAEMILKHAAVFFGGFAEDANLLFVLNRHQTKLNGFYVDLGAHHPIISSNTFLLSLMGWRGINIDASQRAIHYFNLFRPRDMNLNYGISDKAEMRTFYHVGEGLGSSFFKEWVKDISKKNKTALRGEETIRCYPINDILEKFLPEGQEIDLLDIDLEGFDERVVFSYDWEKYRPKYVLVEMHVKNVDEACQNPITKFLRAKDFVMKSVTPPTALFADSRL